MSERRKTHNSRVFERDARGAYTPRRLTGSNQGTAKDWPSPSDYERLFRATTNRTICQGKRSGLEPTKSFMSIRSDIITTSPFFALIPERFSDFETDLDALAYAIEGQLRGTPEMGAIDGFDTFHVLEETDRKLRVVWLAYFLPSSLIPLDASFGMTHDGISYRVKLGAEDATWQRLTEKKRWSAVYLYATENDRPQWNWEPTRKGVFGR